jgi:gamma-glutamyltranspeptidase/glutathione hydrolase
MKLTQPSLLSGTLLAVTLLSGTLLPGCQSKREMRASIATQGHAATRAAQAMLSKGGNLFDAAVAASFVISVERPHSTGIGGGGFWLSYHSASKQWLALDFRERAPRAIRLPAELVKQNPGALPKLLQDTVLGGGIPGLVAGLGEVHSLYGSLSWAQVLQPAIELAENGFSVYPALAAALQNRRSVLAQNPDSAQIFLKTDGSPLNSGDRLIQKDLGRTLREIAREGPQGFYSGKLSIELLQALKRSGSAISALDLEQYRAIKRAPIRTQVMGRTLVLMPPPSSGGVLIPQILGLLEPDAERLKTEGLHSEWGIHRTAQAMQVAYADRARYLGDPDFTKVPTSTLISKEYLSRRRNRFFGQKALAAAEIGVDPQVPVVDSSTQESTNTTHLSLIDGEGNAIATTQSINGWMGSGQVISGTGILLNNTMDDFSVAAGVKNLYGAVGGAPNRLKPGKTPLSSMTPTVVVAPEQSGDRPVLAIGAPGGTRIITCITQTLLQHWIGGLNLANSVSAPRIHQQWIPDEVIMEDPAPRGGFSKSLEASLRARGHKPVRGEVHCEVMAASLDEAVADPRDFGSAVVFTN